MVNKDLIISVFDNKQQNGAFVKEFDWSDEFQIQEKELFFFSAPPGGRGKEMPRKWNGETGRNSKGESIFCDGITKMVKDFKSVQIVRYKRGSESLFHVTAKDVSKTPAKDSAQALEKLVTEKPILTRPIFLAVEPEQFAVSPGHEEHIKIIGESLYACAGWLVSTDATHSNMIFLAIANAVDRKRIFASFPQPPSVSFAYELKLQLHDTWYSHPNPITFIDQSQLATLAASVKMGSNLDKHIFMEDESMTAFHSFIPDPLPSLYDAVSLGNTRCVALLSCQYGDDIPVCAPKKLSKESDEDWIDVALLSGNLNTILFMHVWEEVAFGNYPAHSLNSLREYVMSTRKIQIHEMLNAIQGQSDIVDQVAKVAHQLSEKAAANKISHASLFPNTMSPTIVALPMINETLESYLTTSTTPDHLVDELTGALFVHPVILPISGQSVSEFMCLQKPNFDIMANVPFGPNDRTIHNKGLQGRVESFMQTELNKSIAGARTKEGFIRVLDILSLLRDRSDLNDMHISARRGVNRIIWEDLPVFLPFFSDVSMVNRETLIRTLCSEFDHQKLIEAIMQDMPALCYFPAIDELYTHLHIKAMLTNPQTVVQGMKVAFRVHDLFRVNPFSVFFATETKLAWKALRISAKHIDRSDLEKLYRTLPLPIEVQEILSDPDISSVHAIMMAQQEFKFAQQELKFAAIENENTALRNQISSLAERLDNTIICLIDADNSENNTPLHCAAKKNCWSVVDDLHRLGLTQYTNQKNKDGNTALFLAATRGHTDTVESLIRLGAQIDLPCNSGRTALMMAASGGHTDTVESLVRLGANMEVADENGHTALIKAAWYGHTTTVESLIRSGANIEAITSDGITALMVAAVNGRTEVIETLVRSGANINAKTKKGQTALVLAEMHGHPDTVAALMRLGADILA